MKTNARVQTCGKLYLAGEYAVLAAGQPAIIKAIPIYMTGEIQTASAYRLTSDMFNHSANLEPDPDYALIQEAVGVMNTYLLALGYQLQPFSLKISARWREKARSSGLAPAVVLLF